MDAGDVGRGEEAVDFQQLGVAFEADGVGDDAVAAAVVLEFDPGKHLAADGFVTNPVDEAAELDRLDVSRKVRRRSASMRRSIGDGWKKTYLSG